MREFNALAKRQPLTMNRQNVLGQPNVAGHDPLALPGPRGSIKNRYCRIDGQMARLLPFNSKRHGKLRVNERAGLSFVALAATVILPLCGKSKP